MAATSAAGSGLRRVRRARLIPLWALLLGALVMATGAGVLAPSDNKGAALEFIRFLLAVEAQERFVTELYEYAMIDGAPTPEGQMPLSDLRGPEIDLSDLAGHLESSVELVARSGLS